MKERFRVGVIGCGAIAQIMHIPAIMDCAGLLLHSLYHPSANLVSKCGEKYGVPAERCFTDYQALLEDRQLDFVVISTIDHYAPSLAASRAGICQLIEKPLAFNLEQCDAMIRAAEENHVWISVGYMKNYDPQFQYFKEKVRGIVEPRFVRVHNFSGDMSMLAPLFDLITADDIPEQEKIEGKEAQWAAMRQAIGSGNEDKLMAYFTLILGAIHDMSCMRSLFGAPRRVRSASVNSDQVIANLEYDRFTCSFESDYLARRLTWDESIDVYANDCHAAINFAWPYFKNGPSVVRINENDGRAGTEKCVVQSYDSAFGLEWKCMYECLRSGQPPAVDAAGGREDIALAIEMIRKSAP